jgi:hypothetical protein
MKRRREQLTVRLDPQVMQAAKQRSLEMKGSLSSVVAEAAKESLLSSYRSDREQEILKAVDRNFHALRRLERQLRLELRVLKEMLGLGMRSFLNHTTPIPEVTKNAALRSGKERFHRYLDVLAANLRTGESILKDLPLAESEDQSKSSPPGKDGVPTVKSDHPSKEAAPEPHLKTTHAVVSHARAHPSSRKDVNPHQERGLFEPTPS